jgi:hypothetical protein
MTRSDDWVIAEVGRTEPEAELLCSVPPCAGIECVPQLTGRGAAADDGLGTVAAHETAISPRDPQEAGEILPGTR